MHTYFALFLLLCLRLSPVQAQDPCDYSPRFGSTSLMRVVVDRLPVRLDPDTNSDILGVLERDDTVERAFGSTCAGDTLWAEVTYNGQSGWVAGRG